MHPYLAILRLQAKQLRWVILAFGLSIATFILAVFLIYPGEEGLVDMIELLRAPEFAAFLGTLPETKSEFFLSLWIHFGITSIIPIILAACGIFLGVELVGREQAEGTFDATFSTPQHRYTYILVRIFGSILIILFLILSGLLSSIIGLLLINESFNYDILIQLWSVMGIQTFFAFALGILIGSIVFDRSLGFQLAFIFVALMYLLNMLLNMFGPQLDPSQLEMLKGFSLLHYLKIEDILYNKSFDLLSLTPLIIIGIIFLVLALLIFQRRDLNETQFRPFYVYLNPLYWIRKRKRTGVTNGQDSITQAEIPISRYLVAWLRPLRQRYPVLVDELWAHGLFLTIYAALIGLIVFLTSLSYPGETEAILFIKSMEATPIYYLVTGGKSITVLESKPFLAFVTMNLHVLLWVLFTPYLVYRFYSLETRDYKGTLGDIIWTKPLTARTTCLQRYAAVVIEYLLLVLVSIVSLVIPEVILGQTADTGLEILVYLLTLPAYLGVGILTSLLIVYFPKKKNLSILVVVILVFMNLLGSLNPEVIWLSQLTPFYYFKHVSILFNGLTATDIGFIGMFILLIAIGIILRLQKSERYVVLD